MGHPLETYFWKRVDRQGCDDCWNWKGNKDRDGYGRLTHRKPAIGAHRLSFEIANGFEPTGLVVRHDCDNPSCVNPRHLSAGSQLDNMRDAIARGRHRSGNLASKTHCPHGHEYTPENTMIGGRGGRCCRKCMNLRTSRRNRKVSA